MPCTWSPGEAAAWNNFVRAVSLFNYVAEKIGRPERFDERGYGDRTEDIYGKLCDMVRSLDAQTRETIIYDAKNATARNLANWWEYEQRRDEERRNREAQQKRTQELRDQASLKLTPEECEALGLKGRS